MDLRSGIVRVETAPASSLGVVVRGTRVCAPLAVPHRGVPSRVPACRRDRHGASARMGSRQPLCRVADGTQRAAAGGSSGRPPSLPVLRSVLAGVVALAVGLAAPFWWFDGAVEGLRTATERETAGRRHALLGEDGGCRAVLDRPAPTIDADPELVALRRTLDDARNELSAVRSGLLCELDGTCGTKQDGAGSIYARSASSPISFRNVSRSSCQRRLPAGRVPCTGRSSQTSRKRSAPESGTLRSIRSWLRYPGNRRD